MALWHRTDADSRFASLIFTGNSADLGEAEPPCVADSESIFNCSVHQSCVEMLGCIELVIGRCIEASGWCNLMMA